MLFLGARQATPLKCFGEGTRWQLRARRCGHQHAVAGHPRRQVRRRLSWDWRRSTETQRREGRVGGGDGRLRRVAQPRGLRETMESPLQGCSSGGWEVARESSIWPLQISSTAPNGLGIGSETPLCQPSGHLSEFPKENSSRVAARYCGVSSLWRPYALLTTPRSGSSRLSERYSPALLSLVRPPKTTAILNMVSQITKAPPQLYTSLGHVFSPYSDFDTPLFLKVSRVGSLAPIQVPSTCCNEE